MATFPAGVRGSTTIRDFIEDELTFAGKVDRFPEWSLPVPNSTDESERRWRRAVLLLLLALPGHVAIDVEAERNLQGGNVVRPFGIDDVLRECNDVGGWRRGDIDESVRAADIAMWWDRRFDHDDQPSSVVWGSVVVPTPSERARPVRSFGSRYAGALGWGNMVIANFGDTPCGITDGLILVASDMPDGSTDQLPPLTTIWLAAK